MQTVKKIVIVGPESTGKSTLCRQLADHYHTLWCPEYAREFLEANGPDYKYEDLVTIAKGQLELEDIFTGQVLDKWKKENSHRPPLLFIDTNMYVMKVWSEYVFNQCDQFILDRLLDRQYDLFLLCNIDIPWQYDPLREHPQIEQRQALYDIYHQLMQQQDVKWVDVKGNEATRLATAIEAVDTLIK